MENNTTAKEKYAIKTKIQEFPTNMGSWITTSINLCEVINSYFGGIFKEFYASKIYINDGHDVSLATRRIPNGALYIDLFFSMKSNIGNGITNAIKLVDDNSDNGKINQNDLTAMYLNTVRRYNQTSVYELTDELKDILAPFTFEYIDENTKVNWNEHKSEELSSFDNFANKAEYICRISGLDLVKIIAAIYGTGSNGVRYDYNVTVQNVIPSRAGEYILNVSQLNMATVRELQSALGCWNNNGCNYNVYRG